MLAALSGHFGEVVRETGLALFELNHGTVFYLTESFLLFSTEQRRRLWRKRLLKSELMLFQIHLKVSYSMSFNLPNVG